VKDQYGRGKLVSLVGGEHSISIGAIRATAHYFGDITVVQLDAHADLRDEYEGTPYNHACALYEAQQTTNLIQVGIRSMDKLEAQRVDPERMFYAHELESDEYWIDKAIDLMGEKVYITIDLDAFDPSLVLQQVLQNQVVCCGTRRFTFYSELSLKKQWLDLILLSCVRMVIQAHRHLAF
jgi:agmatinase